MSTTWTGWQAPSPYPPPPPPPSFEPPPPPRRSRRDVLRSLGVGTLFVVITILRIWVRIATFDSDSSDERRSVPYDGEPTMAPTHPYAGTVEVETLDPGTCVDRVPIGFARPVPCDQPHVAEIVASFPVPDLALVDVYRQSLDRCGTEFGAYTGGTGAQPGQAPAHYFVALPHASARHQLVVCYATGRSGENLTGSVRAR